MTTTPIFTITNPIANPTYDGRATAGLRSLKEFPEGTRYVERRNFKTQKLVSIGILWDTTVHTAACVDPGDNGNKILAAFDADEGTIETDPHSYDTIMMAIDPYWSGMGCSPSLGEVVLDRMIRTQEIDIAKAITLLSDADAEARR